ncbi:MAG: hypothetical protein WCH34_07490 [Bacteroidota bacterium]
MKITLDKSIELKSAVIYLSFEKEVERPDIKEYLNGKRFRNPLIENRVRDYLRNIKIFDEKNQLTALGNKAKETGRVKMKEEGKYQIWFCQNDLYFGNKIFYFKRIFPNNDEVSKLNIRFDNDGHILLPDTNNPYSELTLIPKKEYIGLIKNFTDRLSVTWNWTELEKSNFVFSGQLGKSEHNDGIKISNSAIPSYRNLAQVITDILPEWDLTFGVYKVPFNNISEYSKSTFENTYENTWKGFKVQISKLPIAPYDINDAEKWRDWLLGKELGKDYLSQCDFETLVQKINRHKGFSPYASDLSIPTSIVFRKKLSGKRMADNSSAYWHLAAPVDLNPDIPKKFITTSFSLKEGIELSFKEIVEKINDSEVNDLKVFYYDKYIIRKQQQQSVVALFEAFGLSTAYLITEITAENRSDYISKNQPQIIQKDLKQIFSTTRSQHDRYLVLHTKSVISVWQITNSIDYIRFKEETITCESKGQIVQSVTFNKVDKEMLKTDLLNYIINEVKNGK